MRRVTPQCCLTYAVIYVALMYLAKVLISHIVDKPDGNLFGSLHLQPKYNVTSAAVLTIEQLYPSTEDTILKWDKPLDKPPKKNVTILLWTTYYKGNKEPEAIAEHDPLPPYCQVTYDRTQLETADAVVFNALMSDMQPHMTDWPKIRPPNQSWVYRVLESPAYATIHDFGWLNQVAFNRTMTYNLDSDFPTPYGYVRRRTDDDPPVNEKLFDKHIIARKQPVAAMISHCGTLSRREVLLHQLQDKIAVDVHGACGMRVCPRKPGDSEYECYVKLAKSYKFYLSWENSLCPHYITEKFSNALKVGLVPVVYGAGNYTTILPYPKSFIDVRDFNGNMTALAEYLKYLHNNVTAFVEYLQWHKHYIVFNRQGYSGYRKLCNMAAAGQLTGEHAVTNRRAGDFWSPNQCTVGPKMVTLKSPKLNADTQPPSADMPPDNQP